MSPKRTNGPLSLTLLGGGFPYTISIGIGLRSEMGAIISREAGDRRIVVITDRGVRRALGDEFEERMKGADLSFEFLEFKGGESAKTQDTVTELQHEMLRMRFGRDTLLIALGGGIVGDVAGFVAATYMRGIPYIQIPTTLLSMVDSSIGGKVGIDTPHGKNLIGAFWMPRAVIMDIAFLAKLPAKEIINGLFEAVKTFFTSDAESIELVRRIDPKDPSSDLELLKEIVAASVQIKSGITDRDPREENERKVINFGHTIGHAVELLSKYELPHGFAVAYGMLAEALVSRECGILSREDAKELFSIMRSLGIRPEDFPAFSSDAIIDATKIDKKSRAGVPHYVLISRIGAVYVKDGKYAHAVEEEIVRKALQSL